MGVSSYLCFRELCEMTELLIMLAAFIAVYAWTVSNMDL